CWTTREGVGKRTLWKDSFDGTSVHIRIAPIVVVAEWIEFRECLLRVLHHEPGQPVRRRLVRQRKGVEQGIGVVWRTAEPVLDQLLRFDLELSIDEGVLRRDHLAYQIWNRGQQPSCFDPFCAFHPDVCPDMARSFSSRSAAVQNISPLSKPGSGSTFSIFLT